MSAYYTLLTKIGLAKLTNAQSSGSVVQWSHMAVGDGNGAAVTPTETQTALVHETFRAPINQLAVDEINPNYLIAEMIIPATTGGFTIREAGIFDTEGNLVAVANSPENYKPVLSEGSATDLIVRIIVMLSNTDTVQLKIDPSVVLATRKYVDDSITTALNKQDGKQSVRLATTAAIALTGLQVIDGVQLASGDRVLVKDQAAGKENGIYVAASGAWSRASDADASIEVTPGLFVTIELGTANADSLWQLVTDGVITLGTTALAFEMVAGKADAAIATGSADAITATFYPAIKAISNGTTVRVKAASANATTTPTFTPASGITAKVIVKASGTALVAGDIITGHWMELTYDATQDKWILRNPITGIATVTSANDSSYADDSARPASTSWIRAALATLATAAGFTYSLGVNGYIKAPNWLGSFILNWFSATTSSGVVTCTFPLAFSSACYALIPIDSGGNAWTTSNVSLVSYKSPTLSKTGVTLRSLTWTGSAFSDSSTVACSVWAFGK